MESTVPDTLLASRSAGRWVAAAVVALAAGCGDTPSTAPETPGRGNPVSSLQVFDCQADLRATTVTCGAPAGEQAAIIGGPNVQVRLISSNLVNVGGALEFDVEVQNLLNEAIGTPDGVIVDPDGITAFFHSGPNVVKGTGTAWVDNADGVGDFTGSNQPYFRYPQMLAKDHVSASKPWRIAFDPGVENITFKVFLSAEVQPLLVINEVMINPLNPDPDNPSVDTDREWFEVYNAGSRPVEMEGMLIADSAASGRRPYHRIASPLTVQPGAYVVLGASTNTTSNGGATVDYSYGGALVLANSLDALKISRLYSVPGDTVTLDRTQFAQASVSAQAGISRELKNPGLDNSNLDGSNWANASVTSVYGNGGRGTPKAQNSTYVP